MHKRCNFRFAFKPTCSSFTTYRAPSDALNSLTWTWHDQQGMNSIFLCYSERRLPVSPFNLTDTLNLPSDGGSPESPQRFPVPISRTVSNFSLTELGFQGPLDGICTLKKIFGALVQNIGTRAWVKSSDWGRAQYVSIGLVAFFPKDETGLRVCGLSCQWKASA
ncbi:Oligopeptide transporter 2 [Fusarium oxysporum f. sp. albedinis]|nr:Oligopeptide transporter 2 [Fusarium oxysporum f. sp. albedinis]